MGAYLANPLTEKHTITGENAVFEFAASCMQGWRISMEDAEISEITFGENESLFAVFDGHGGQEVAKFCKANFGEQLKANENYKNGNYPLALKETFFKMDEILETPEGQKEMESYRPVDERNQESHAGCTANVLYINGSTAYIANAGDSRTVLWSGNKMVELSVDHKPMDDIEMDRITKAGGWVSMGRVNGNLNLSRAIGDLEYKRNKQWGPEMQIISAEPDIVTHQINLVQDQFFLMGCDGVWELKHGTELCQHAAKKLQEGESLDKIVEQLLDLGMAEDTSSKIFG